MAVPLGVTPETVSVLSVFSALSVLPVSPVVVFVSSLVASAWAAEPATCVEALPSEMVPE